VLKVGAIWICNVWDLGFSPTSKVGGFGFALFGIWDLDPHPKLGDLDLHCLGFYFLGILIADPKLGAPQSCQV
jgi:hypothetical protein